jgi:hypothetical protein
MAMNETHAELLPEIEDGLNRVSEQAKERRVRIDEWKKEREARGEEVPRFFEREHHPLDPDRLDALLHPPSVDVQRRRRDSDARSPGDSDAQSPADEEYAHLVDDEPGRE